MALACSARDRHCEFTAAITVKTGEAAACPALETATADGEPEFLPKAGKLDDWHVGRFRDHGATLAVLTAFPGLATWVISR